MDKWQKAAQIVKNRTENTIKRISYAGAQEVKALAVATNTEPNAHIGLFSKGVDHWKAGTTYQQYDLFEYNGNIGFVKQPKLTSSEIYPPFSVGTEALYGARPAPDDEGVYPYVYNMAASVGMLVRDGDTVYECIQAIPDMLYPPSMLASHFIIDFM